MADRSQAVVETTVTPPPVRPVAAGPAEVAAETAMPQATVLSVPATALVYRHAAPVRLLHWLNALSLFILIMSGLQIFNAHQALYWGERSDRDRPWLSIRAVKDDSGEMHGVTTIAGRSFDTTGLLGYSDGSRRGFPAWATVPSGKWLAMGRQWHFFFAWVFVLTGLSFAVYGVASRHFGRELVPTARDWRNLGRDLVNHLKFAHPTGEEAKRYNVLQKLAYSGILFVVAPTIVLTGLTMSPWVDAGFPQLLTLFGGRQSARSIHFLACFAFVGFIVVHLFMVLTTGLANNLRSMLTGWYRITLAGGTHDAESSSR